MDTTISLSHNLYTPLFRHNNALSKNLYNFGLYHTTLLYNVRGHRAERRRALEQTSLGSRNEQGYVCAVVGSIIDLSGSIKQLVWGNQAACVVQLKTACGVQSSSLCGSIKQHVWCNQAACVVQSSSLWGAVKQLVWCNQAACVVKSSSLYGAIKQLVWCNQSACVVQSSSLCGPIKQLCGAIKQLVLCNQAACVV